MALGTYGFMPPEALANRLNLSSDLYSLGVTLICLICGISSSRIGSYIDDDCQIDAKNLLSNVSLPNDFKNWLLMLVSRTMSLRPKNAFLALQSFKMMKGLAQKGNISVTSVVACDFKDEQIQSISKETKKSSSLLHAKKLSILAISLPITFLAFPWIAVQSDSYFSIAKQLQENYLSFQNKVNIEDCYQGIYSASEAKMLEEAKTFLERSSSCLNTIKYPISFAETEAKLDKLFTLKKVVVLAEKVQAVDYRSKTFQTIDELQESLVDQANAIKGNLDLLSQTRQQMNKKLFFYCLQTIVLMILCYYFILGIGYIGYLIFRD